ncbi:hypothetical protein V502_05417 [Pseudogymnoascus sp. VKM F-4520 (FW-2644)]|nr:hypothetical protein V502_05417 [Pseudogymnoascus sp. VKM F-4520 (FW-2644)]
MTPDDGDSRRKRRRQFSVRASDVSTSPGEFGSMRPGVAKGSSSFVGSGSGIYFVRAVQSAFARNYSQSSHAIDDEFVPGEDDHLQIQNPSGSLWNSEEVCFISASQPIVSISFDDLVRWSQSFFNNWHPLFPFLHAPSILVLFERIATHGVQSLGIVEAITVRSVLSISVADRRQMPKDDPTLIPSNLVFSTIDEAISSLTPVIMQPSTLSALQALVAIQVFLISMLRLNAASRIGGLIVRITFHLGLHRCPSRFKQFTLAEADMRRRLFWAIYSLERYLSQSLGLPLDLKDDDVDVCYPDNELHDIQANEAANGQQLHDPRLLLLPSFLARHGKIKGLILELRHKCANNRTTSPDEVSYVDAEISKWWNEAQDLLEPDYINDAAEEESDGGQTPCLLKETHKLLIIVQKHESTILLNRPLITSGYDTSLFAAAMQKCIGASKQIVSKVYLHLHEGMNKVGSRDGKIPNPLFWPGFTWCIWMSGLILVYAASEGYYSIEIAQREAGRCVKILETLSLRGNFWPGACASALIDLQKALGNKLSNGTLGQHVGLQSRTKEMRTSTDAPNSISRQNVRLRNSETGTMQDTGGASATPRAPNPDFLPHGSPGAYQGNRQAPSMNNSIPAHLGSPRGDMSIPFQQIEASTLESNRAPGYVAWPMLNGPTYQMGDQFNGFDDIFQLMDASYQINEQMYEPGDMTQF